MACEVLALNARPSLPSKQQEQEFFALVEMMLILGFVFAIDRLYHQGGAEVLALVIFCVYFSNVAGLYGGRLLSRRGGMLATKLAPRISPNKTVIGVVCGVVVAMLLATAVSLGFGTPYGEIKLLLALAACALVEPIGDLAESWLKRLSQRKDSSHLLWGHGGVLDRNDGLLLASIVAWGFVSIHWL
jgi:phosphatidate cytidylyltransferase